MKKKKYVLFFLVVVGLTSCESWFDVSPENQVSSDDLYATGTGYRMQLNGIYKALSETSLYGKELSWGFLDILGQYYTEAALNDDQKEINKFLYKGPVVKAIASSIWSQMYHSIADCNNLIEHVSKADSNLFANGGIECYKIHGEALAMRAFIHFDLLRLFAPLKDDGGKYIPYVTDSESTINPKLTVQETLEKIVVDLKAALPLLVKWDSSSYERDGQMVARIQDIVRSDRFTVYVSQNINAVSIFERTPGYRMHYAAARAILARVYSYMGNKKAAYEAAKAVCDLSDGFRAPFDLNQEWDVEETSNYGQKKLLGDVILAFYNEKNVDNFASSLGVTPLFLRNLDGVFDGDALGSDVRYLYLTTRVRDEGRVSVKNRQGTTNVGAIPVIRKSELYYIMGEYLAENADIDGACALIREIKERRSDMSTMPTISTTQDFMDYMLIDARREFIGEGQSFFMYKRLNLPLWDGASTYDLKGRSFLPIPESENVIL